jgi:hypothetical protein
MLSLRIGTGATLFLIRKLQHAWCVSLDDNRCPKVPKDTRVIQSYETALCVSLLSELVEVQGDCFIAFANMLTQP